jgi:hypothetical protein
MGKKLSTVLAASLLVAAELVGAAAVQDVDGLEVARRMASAGAIDLALERVNQEQPAEVSAPAWVDWELLRLDLLWRRGRDAEVLKRTALVRNVALPDRAQALLWLTAARAAQRLGQPAQARAAYVRYFLRTESDSGDYRTARVAVIDTYLSEGKTDDAYRSMLRFQQDFSPLRTEEAERFVSALLAAGRATEAATWLPQLDKASPSAAILRLRAGLINPDAAIAHARSLLAKGAGEPALLLLTEVAVLQKNRTLEIEAREHRLNTIATEFDGAAAQHAEALWNLYREAGQQAGNREQLLIGDDAAWIERAVRLGPAQPQVARALLGHIASVARDADARARAQLLLVTSLRDARLALTALRLFFDPRDFPVAGLDARVRFELGGVAADSKRPSDAVRYWDGLAQPPNLSAHEWRLRHLAVLLQSGKLDAGLEAAKSVLTARPAPPPQIVGRLISIAEDTLDAWHAKPAEALFAMLLPLTRGTERISVFLGMGRAHELRGQFRLAATAFLNAAVLSASPETDREALRARAFAASNLAKAGMLDDARSTYEWLAANAKDPVIRESAARALKNL